MAVDISKLGEYLALAPKDIYRLTSLLPVPRPEKARPMRTKIDYIALRAQYEQLLLNGTCATRDDVARHLGVSRVWVSRVLKGIKRKGS